MESPIVTIVTPSFNQGRFIRATIESVLGQDYPDVEYVSRDAGSTDETASVVRDYASRLTFISEPDRGQSHAINKGFAEAKGSILAWLNSDDTYAPGAVMAAVRAFEAGPDCGLIYGDANYIDEGGRIIGRFPAAQTDFVRLRHGYVHVPQQAAFFRAHLWKTLGPLDPSFYFAMDYDLWLRIARHAQVKYIPEIWANFRLHTAAKTIADDDRCWPEMLRIHYRDGGTFFSVIVAKYYLRKLLAPIWNRRRRRMLAG